MGINIDFCSPPSGEGERKNALTVTKITDADIRDLLISSLPSRPTAPTSFGGAGYTAKDMKAAFDRLPLYIIGRFNALLEDIAREGEGGVSESILTGISDGHSLKELFSDIRSGEFANYLTVLGKSLAEVILELEEELSALEGSLGTSSAEVGRLGEGIRELEAAVAEATSALEGTRDEHTERMDTLGSEIEALKEKHEEDVAAIRAAIESPTELTLDLGGPEELTGGGEAI